jgi:hypothetical protein
MKETGPSYCDHMEVKMAESRAVDINDKLRLRDRFRDILTEAASHRCDRDGIVETSAGREFEWVCYERGAMFAAVNRVRVERGLDRIGMDEIIRADQHATGHVDWLDKFPLYCAELASR